MLSTDLEEFELIVHVCFGMYIGFNGLRFFNTQ